MFAELLQPLVQHTYISVLWKFNIIEALERDFVLHTR